MSVPRRVAMEERGRGDGEREGREGGEGVVPPVFTDSQAESLWKDIVTGGQKRNRKLSGVDTTKRSSMKESEGRQSKEVDEKHRYRYAGKEGNDNNGEVVSGMAVREGGSKTGVLPESGATSGSAADSGSADAAGGSVGGGAGGTVRGTEISASDAATATPATAAAAVGAAAGMPVSGAAVAAGSSPAAAAAPDAVAAEAATAGAAAARDSTTASALVAGATRVAGAAAGAKSAADNSPTPVSAWPAGNVSAGTTVPTEADRVCASKVASVATTGVDSAAASGGAIAATADVTASRAEQALEQTVGYGEHGIDFLLIPRQDDPENVGLSLVGDQGGEAKRSTGLLVGEDQGEMESIVSGEYERRQQLDAVWELNAEDVVATVKGKGAGKGGGDGGGKDAGIDSKNVDVANEGDFMSGISKKEGSVASDNIGGDKGNALKSSHDARERTYAQEELFDVASSKYDAGNMDIDGSEIREVEFFLMTNGEHGKAA